MKKIYTEVRIDMASGETLAESSYLYDGEIAECKGGSSPAYPEPTREERALWEKEAAFIDWQREWGQTQSEWQKKQWEEQEKLTPLMYESAGYVKDPETGEYTRDPRRVELEEEQLKYSLAGYKGELPIDPAVTEQFNREERLAKEASSRGGTDLVKALSDIKQRRLAAEYAIRHGSITNASAFGTFGGTGGGVGGGISGGSYGGLLSQYSGERANKYQGQLQQEYDTRMTTAGRMSMMAAGAKLGTGTGGPGWGTAIGAGAGLLASYLYG